MTDPHDYTTPAGPSPQIGAEWLVFDPDDEDTDARAVAREVLRQAEAAADENGPSRPLGAPETA